MKYVLITAARNEEAFIAKTLESVTAQTQLPEHWVIVDDGSTDRTAEIVEDYGARFPWISLIRRAGRRERHFAGKADAVNTGFKFLETAQFDVIGNLDADVSFEPDFMEFLMQQFSEDKQLGVAGAPYIEGDFDSARDSFEGENFVAGQAQLFRRQCFQEIGGYAQSRAGGVDWIAVMTARMLGWKTKSFAEKRFHHHRAMSTAERGILAAHFSYGQKDYYLGGSPLWEIFRVGYRAMKKPFLIGGIAVLLGYCHAVLCGTKRPVSPELMRFHRRNQMRKLKKIFRSLMRFKKVDNFRLETSRTEFS
ncbi:MAG TPA: glycosyltransferase family 2 protein [Methylomirabilota bacterium]|nr:glycosyltransferase family 2 protein [Methylomirabilota bacterium]